MKDSDTILIFCRIALDESKFTNIFDLNSIKVDVSEIICDEIKKIDSGAHTESFLLRTYEGCIIAEIMVAVASELIISLGKVGVAKIISRFPNVEKKIKKIFGKDTESIELNAVTLDKLLSDVNVPIVINTTQDITVNIVRSGEGK